MEAIYATDINNGLSKDGLIPWKSKKDMNFFMNNTKYNVVIMGRKTYFSLPDNVRPLKNRLNIVLTSNIKQFEDHKEVNHNVRFTDDINIYNSILKNKNSYKQMFPYLNSDFKIFIIGGKNIYEPQIVHNSSRLFLQINLDPRIPVRIFTG